MITKVTHVTRHFADADAARKFYTEQLGFIPNTDSMVGPNQRWLTLSPPGQPDFEVVLMDLGWYTKGVAESIRAGLAQQPLIILETDDVDGLFAQLKAAGASLDADEVRSLPWGRDLTVKDPSGSSLNIVQPLG